MLKPVRFPLPSLKALRAFEVAARNGSFLKAADELGLTPGAIAQQVRKFEEWIGRPLFDRHAHGVTLLDDAARSLGDLTDAFDGLGRAVQSMRSALAPARLRIAALPSIAQLWLAPRLTRIKDTIPHAEISVSALEQPPSFARDMYDIAIFYAATVPGDAVGITLADDALFPVAAPTIALSKPADLAHQVLLHDSSWPNAWEQWLSAAGVKGVQSRRGPAYSLYSLALQTAVSGGGVLIGRRTLVAEALASGRVVRPFDLELMAKDPLTLMVPRHRPRAPEQSMLIEWLQRS